MCKRLRHLFYPKYFHWIFFMRRSKGTLKEEVGCVISLMHHLRSRNTQVYAQKWNCKQKPTKFFFFFSSVVQYCFFVLKPNHVGDKRIWKTTDSASIQAFHSYWQAIWRNYQQWWGWPSFCSFFIERSVSRSDKR